MSLLTKIFTAVRGGAREAGEAVVDANGLRIFEQEIKDAENALEKAKRDLTQVMAHEMQENRKIESVQADIAKHEGYAAKALEKNDEALALEIAQKIADFQGELQIHEKARAQFSAHAERLKAMIKQTGKALTDMQRQLVMVKTTDSVQKATTAITQNYAAGSSKLLTAKESLDRIKQKQQNLEDRLAAGEALQDEMNGKSLEMRMRESGIIESDTKAQDILAQIKAKQGTK